MTTGPKLVRRVAVRTAGWVLLALGCLLAWKHSRGAQDLRAVQLAPDMVVLPPETFLMGSLSDESGRDIDEPAEQKYMAKRAALSTTEVTRRQWEAVAQPLARALPEEDWQRPVEGVEFEDALAFCNRLSEIEGLPPCYELDGAEPRWPQGLDCKGYRLPTDAEWEHAARAGTITAWWFGDDPAKVIDHVVFVENSEGRSAPVGSKPANPWGFHDLLGNVREWVWDVYCPPSYKGDTSPGRDCGEPARVVRGGSYEDPVRHVRAANKCGQGVRYPRCGPVGFRVARTFAELGEDLDQ